MAEVNPKPILSWRLKTFALSLCCVLAGSCSSSGQQLFVNDVSSGLRLEVANEHALPALRIQIPGRPAHDEGILVIFPEHVTVRKSGATEGEQLYLWRPGAMGKRPDWKREGSTLTYTSEFAGGMHMVASATLERDGVLFRYEFENRSSAAFDAVQAITDPRMQTPYLRDVRLERTYMHRNGKFVLMASDVPERLTMPLSLWLPSRYRVPYVWNVEPQSKVRQADGVMWYNARARADEPVIATVSTDGAWIVASFSHNPGNIWSNPELTCQHVDPDLPLKAGARGSIEVKILILHGALSDVETKVQKQRPELEP